jgi:hypothetical protein
MTKTQSSLHLRSHTHTHTRIYKGLSCRILWSFLHSLNTVSYIPDMGFGTFWLSIIYNYFLFIWRKSISLFTEPLSGSPNTWSYNLSFTGERVMLPYRWDHKHWLCHSFFNCRSVSKHLITKNSSNSTQFALCTNQCFYRVAHKLWGSFSSVHIKVPSK